MHPVAHHCQRLKRLFTEHPEHAGETYWSHLWYTTKIAASMVRCGATIMIHGLFPFLCTFTASTHMERLYTGLKNRAAKTRAAMDNDTHG